MAQTLSGVDQVTEMTNAHDVPDAHHKAGTVGAR